MVLSFVSTARAIDSATARAGAPVNLPRPGDRAAGGPRGTGGVIAQDEHDMEISAGSLFLSVVDSTFGGHMSETLTLPVLPLDDEVVLPGMVVPIELTDPEIRGAIDAA